MTGLKLPHFLAFLLLATLGAARVGARALWVSPAAMVQCTGHASSSSSSLSGGKPLASLRKTSALLSRRGGQLASPSSAYVALKSPAENFENAVAIGVKKSNQSPAKIFVLGILAGFQVGIGAAMAVATLGGLSSLKESNIGLAKILFGIVGLPCSLLMVMITGSELFTGNTALVGAAFMEGKVGLRQLMKSWVWSYAGNLLGGGMLAALCHYAGVFSSVGPAFAAAADAKASFPFGVAVARGIVCNWLVCSALWMSIAASDLASKAITVLMVITIFAALGFEHSVANMFIGPFGALSNAKTSLFGFYNRNLLPVTVGNIIGGVLLCAGFQYLAYGSTSFLNKKKAA